MLSLRILPINVSLHLYDIFFLYSILKNVLKLYRWNCLLPYAERLRRFCNGIAICFIFSNQINVTSYCTISLLQVLVECKITAITYHAGLKNTDR